MEALVYINGKLVYTVIGMKSENSEQLEKRVRESIIIGVNIK